MFRMQIEGGLFGNVCPQPWYNCCMDPVGLEVMGESSPRTALFRVKDNSWPPWLIPPPIPAPGIPYNMLKLILLSTFGMEPAWSWGRQVDPVSASMVKLFPLCSGVFMGRWVAPSSRAGRKILLDLHKIFKLWNTKLWTFTKYLTGKQKSFILCSRG